MQFENVRVLLLDDEDVSLEHSRRLLSAFVQEENISACTNAVTAMGILNERSFDLVFLDIEMPDANGFSMAEFVHSRQSQAKVVFLTGHVELGAKSFDYEPFDFLGKPLELMRLQKTFDRFAASRKRSAPAEVRVAVDTSTGFVLLSPDKIGYITREKRRTLICCGADVYVSKYTLDELEDIFGEYGIFRVHQSYLVPLGRIASVSKAQFGATYFIQLDDGTTVPVSRNQYPKLCARLAEQGIRFL